jgi:hypothetical protein
MNKFFGYALTVILLSSGTSWVKMFNDQASSTGSGWSRSVGSWGGGYGGGSGGGGGGHK